MKTNQDAVILMWLAAQTCDYHKAGFDIDCGFCRNALVAVNDAFQYGKNGKLPLILAEKLISG